MAEGGADTPPREPQEVDFGEEDQAIGPLCSTSSAFGSLQSKEETKGNTSLDEGYPTSPDPGSAPGGLPGAIPRVSRSSSQETLRKLEEFLKMSEIGKMSETNRVQLDNCRAIYEELSRQVSASSTDVEQLFDRVKGLQRQIDEQQQQLEKLTPDDVDDEKKDSQQREREEEIGRRVKEGMERALEDRMEKLEERVMARMQEKMVRQMFEREQAAAQGQGCSPDVMDHRAVEFQGAMRKALEERDEARKKFRVSLVRLRAEQENNTALLDRIQQLEARCRELSAENRQLKLRDYVHKTHFTAQSPMLECFSCRCEYSTNANPPSACHFHPLASMPYESWRNYISADDLPANFLQSDSLRSFYYWACCNVLATRRPEGCCSGRHHQQWEMDIMMRQVMMESSNCDHLMAPLSVHTLDM